MAAGKEGKLKPGRWDVTLIEPTGDNTRIALAFMSEPPGIPGLFR